MPTIYDNIDADLLDGLKDSLTAAHARRAFCRRLKECEFRFNHRQEKVYKVLPGSCEELPLNLS